MGIMTQAQNMDPMFGSGQLSHQQRASLGLGGPQMGGGSFNSQQFQMMQQNMENQSGNPDVENRLAQLKDDIAQHKDSGNKRGMDGTEGPMNKRAKSGAKNEDGK
jgi:hypothetical protein